MPTYWDSFIRAVYTGHVELRGRKVGLRSKHYILLEAFYQFLEKEDKLKP